MGKKFIFDLDTFNDHIDLTCPCKIPHVDNMCPCVDFRDNGRCVCGLFKQLEEVKE